MSMPEEHFALLEKVTTRPEAPADLLRAVLPRRVREAFDLSTLRGTDFRCPELGPGLVFEVDLSCGRGAFIFLRIETETPDWLYAVGVLKALCEIWDDWVEAHPDAEKIPFVLPVVLNAGPEPWEVPVRYQDLYHPVVHDSPLYKYALKFEYLLVELAEIDDPVVRRP